MNNDLTILIPAHERPESLKMLLNFLDGWKVIVCLNGNSEDALIKYDGVKSKFPKVKFITSEKGVNNARNALLRENKSDYVWFIDDDDLPNEAFLRALKDMKFTDDVYEFKIDNNKDGAVVDYFKVENNQIFGSVVLWSRIYNSRVFDNYEFAECFYFGEDLAFNVFLYENGIVTTKIDEVGITADHLREEFDSSWNKEKQLKAIETFVGMRKLNKPNTKMVFKRLSRFFIFKLIFTGDVRRTARLIKAKRFAFKDVKNV